MPHAVSLIGVPSSAGASWPGQEKGPAAYRTAGIVTALEDHGISVDDRADLQVERWQSALTVEDGRQVNNADRTVVVARQVKQQVRGVLDEKRFPLVLGGDCTITVGAYAAAVEAGTSPLLIYVDEGSDTATPATTDEAHLDGMGVAHMLNLPHTTALRDIGPATPLLQCSDVIFLGLVGDEVHFPEGYEPLGITPADQLRGRGRQAGLDALKAIGTVGRPFWLHFDVDVIDFFDLPVADVPVFRGGTPFTDVAALIKILASDHRCLGMTVTEFNPDHANPDGREARILVEALAQSLLA